MTIKTYDPDWCAAKQTISISPDEMSELLASAAAAQANMAQRNAELFIRHNKKKYITAAAVSVDQYAVEEAQVIPITAGISPEGESDEETITKLTEYAALLGLELIEGGDCVDASTEAWRKLPLNIQQAINRIQLDLTQENSDE